VGRTIALAVAILWCWPAGVCAGAENPPLQRHATLGAGVRDVNGSPSISIVVPSSPAAVAGLEAGDIIKTVDLRPIQTAAEFLTAIRLHRAGVDVAIAVVRAGLPLVLHTVLIPATDESDPAVETIYGAVSVASTQRRTLLTVPKNMAGRRPAVLLIGGIGCYSVDIATQTQDPYIRVTHDLSRAGFVTMRLEKSGVGDSAGPACRSVDFNDESASYAIALAALRNDPRVDPAHVYLLGHSIGSLIAPRLALQQPVAGTIVAEAVGRNWFEYELDNTRRQLVLGSEPDPPATVDAKMTEKEVCMHELLIEKRPEAAIERERPACKIHNGIYPVDAPYVQQVAALNVAQPWTQLNVPVLVIYGTSDFETAAEDQQRITDIVNGVHPGSATLIVLDGMDHQLRLAGTAQIAVLDAERGTPEAYDQRFSATVTRWLCERETCAPYKEEKTAL
jgi:alpha-beta hydrolase superfamily lysophospholipase